MTCRTSEESGTWVGVGGSSKAGGGFLKDKTTKQKLRVRQPAREAVGSISGRGSVPGAEAGEAGGAGLVGYTSTGGFGSESSGELRTGVGRPPFRKNPVTWRIHWKGLIWGTGEGHHRSGKEPQL